MIKFVKEPGINPVGQESVRNEHVLAVTQFMIEFDKQGGVWISDKNPTKIEQVQTGAMSRRL